MRDYLLGAPRKRVRKDAHVPHKDKARGIVNRAIQKGHLVRPKKCARCGRKPGYGTDGRALIHAHHHKGYDHPLAVEWLCVKCHFVEDPRVNGEQQGFAKLTWEIVYVIRAARGSISQELLAKRYGVRQTTISRIQLRQIWKEERSPRR